MERNKGKKYLIVDEDGKVINRFRLSNAARESLRYYKKNFKDNTLKLVVKK